MMAKLMKKTSAVILILVVSCAFLAGYVINDATDSSSWWPENLAHAAAATQDSSFAMAVGPVDSDVEGLYMLDFLTGELTCTVLNHRGGKFNAVFKGNVIQDLGINPGQRPKYLLMSGEINFPRGGGAARPGQSVIYVLDTTSGAYGAYGVPWRRERANGGFAQTGNLMFLDGGRARTAPIRE